MKKNNLLLKTLLLSTSSFNIYRHTTDKKKKGKIVGAFIGLIVLYAMIMGYFIASCIGYGHYGLIEAAPVLCAVSISILAFFFTFFKTNGYLFNFKEYDMLMSLPFEAKTVAACKFLYMYVKSLSWYMSISVAMMIGYGIYARPAAYTYILWIVLSLFLPIIPMLAASFLGFIIARISAGFKKTNIIQTILTIAFVLFSFSIRFILEDMFRNNKTEDVLNQMSAITDNAAGFYFPARWFADAINKSSISGAMLLAGVSVILFTVIFMIVGRSYRNINSSLKNHAASKNYKMTAQKTKSILNTIAFKEFRRFTGSTAYLVNGGMGQILCVIASILVLIVGLDNAIAMVMQGAPVTVDMLRPAIPLVIYFFIGMVATTACSPSLEGKNYWIVKSLPISTENLYKGKMLFNMYITVPFMTFGILCLCISARVPVLETILYIILGIALCAFSTTWGCVCGVKHLKLDWENEIEVIKQSAAVAIYMFPNMIVTMGLIVLVVVLGMHMSHNLIAVILIAIASALAALSYLRVMALAKKNK